MPYAAGRKPIVSVIIVNYNTDKLVAKSVKSLSGFPGVEVIVLDNSSPHQNLGFSQAVNQGVKQSQAKYICLLNPDASIGKTAITQLVETATSYGDHAIIAPRLINPDGAPQPSCYPPQSIWNAIKEFWLGKKGSYSKYLPADSGPVHAAVAACWLVPRKVWEVLGGLDEKYFLYFEDLDFCDRAKTLGIPIIYDSRVKVVHEHGISASTNPNTAKLFQQSALLYHGHIKKLMIDFVIKVRDLFIPPVSTKKIIGILILYTLFVFAIASLGYFLLPSRFAPSSLVPSLYSSNFLLWAWANFDGAHYLNIAQHGYQTIMGQSEYAFFPFFPLLINLLSRTGLDSYLSAHLITLFSDLGFVWFLIKWVANYTKNPLTLLWLILLSPGAIFLSAIYSEPLFLFLTILTFYSADHKQWGKAIIFTALATATRVNGIFLVLLLLIKMGKNRLFALLGLSGLISYMGYLHLTTGDSLAFFHAQSGWEKSTATFPWVTAINYGRALTTEFVPDLTHLVVIIEVLVTFLLIYLLILLWRQKKLDLAYKLYALGGLALPLATGSLGSMPRFSLTIFPLFLMIPTFAPKFRFVTYSLFLITCIIGIILFTRGYWYA